MRRRKKSDAEPHCEAVCTSYINIASIRNHVQGWSIVILGGIPTPNGQSIDRFAIFPHAPINDAAACVGERKDSLPPSIVTLTSSLKHRQQAPSFTILTLCLCVGKRLFIMVQQQQNDLGSGRRSRKSSDNFHTSSSSTSSSSPWQMQQELMLPERAHCLMWLDAVHVLVGFAKEYSCIDTVTGDVVDLCSIDSGTTMLHRLSPDRTLLNGGNKALVHYSDGQSHTLVDSMLYPGTEPRSLGNSGSWAFALDAHHLHVYRQPSSGVSSWRTTQNIQITNGSVLCGVMVAHSYSWPNPHRSMSHKPCVPVIVRRMPC